MSILFQQLELKNKFAGVSLPISYNKFRRLLNEFQKQCKENLGDDCVLQTRLMTEAPFHQVWIEPDAKDDAEIRAMEHAENDRKTIAHLDGIDKLSHELYKQANYIEITAMTAARANGGPDYKDEYSGGKLELKKDKSVISVTMQALKKEIDLSL